LDKLPDDDDDDDDDDDMPERLGDESYIGKKVKDFPYRALGPELIPVYRQSARRR